MLDFTFDEDFSDVESELHDDTDAWIAKMLA